MSLAFLLRRAKTPEQRYNLVKSVYDIMPSFGELENLGNYMVSDEDDKIYDEVQQILSQLKGGHPQDPHLTNGTDKAQVVPIKEPKIISKKIILAEKQILLSDIKNIDEKYLKNLTKKQLERVKHLSSGCEHNKIKNPATGNCVKIDGAKGRSIIFDHTLIGTKLYSS